MWRQLAEGFVPPVASEPTKKLTQASANAWRQICVVCESSVKQDCWGSPWPAAYMRLIHL